MTRRQTISGPMHQSGIRALEECPEKFRRTSLGERPIYAPFDRGILVAIAAEAIRASHPTAFDGYGFREIAHAAMLEALHSGAFPPESFDAAAMVVGAMTVDETDPFEWVTPEGSERTVESSFTFDDLGEHVSELDEHFLEDFGAFFRGTRDVLDVFDGGRRIVVSDDKTWQNIPAAAEIPFDLQARAYVFGTFAEFPEAESVTWKWNLLRHGFPLTWTFERRGEWREGLVARIDAAKRKRDQLAAHFPAYHEPTEDGTRVVLPEWPKTVGPGCGSCPIAYACADVKLAIENGRTLPLDRETRANTWRLLKDLLAAYDAALRVDAIDEPIRLVDGRLVGYRTKSRRSPKPDAYEEARERFAALGGTFADFDAAFPPSVGVTKLQQIFATLPEVGKAGAKRVADEFFDAQTYSEFTTYKGS